MSDEQAPSTPAARRKARRFALQALYGWQIAGNALKDIERQYLDDNDMRKVDRQYFHDLVHGIPARLDEINQALGPCLDRRLDELTQVEKAILRIAVFELITRPDVPVRVVINEGIELAKIFGAEDSFKYVNGVLDKAARVHRKAEFTAR